MREEPAQRGPVLDLVLTNKDDLVGMRSSRAAWAEGTWNGGFRILKAARRAHSEPWDSGKQFASSGICLAESHEVKPWREEGLRMAG